LGAKYDIPVVAICGIQQLDQAGIQSLGLQKVFAVADHATSKHDSMTKAAHYIVAMASEIHAFWKEQ